MSIADRKSLVENNGPLLHNYKSSVTLTDGMSCMTKSIEFATKNRQPWVAEISDKLEKMNMLDKKPKLEYEQVRKMVGNRLPEQNSR